MGNTYYATSAAQQLAEAQDTLNKHVTSSATGRCLICDSLGPCWRRESAVAIFSRSLRLPARMPGASRPELINAVRIGGPPRYQVFSATSGGPRSRQPDVTPVTDDETFE